jgi:putative transcriptional regulator
VDSLQGHLLLSAASLWDPNFRKTVVLIGHHDDEGAVGVVLNRSTEVTVAEAVPPLADIVPPDEPLFIGGPVQPQAAVVLADFEDPSHAEILALGSIGFLPEEVDPDEVGGIRRARVYSGYSGWGPGQLEAEIARGDWQVTEPDAALIFESDGPLLWEALTRRTGTRVVDAPASRPGG